MPTEDSASPVPSPEAQLNDKTVNEVNDSEVKLAKCFICEAVASNFCRHCGQDFCEQHKSKYQNNLCCKCLTDENLQIQNEPLIDDEGARHEGRKIRLIGEGWPNSLRLIKDTSDDDLKEQIKGLQNLLQDAVKTADYARISIAAREYELDYREHSRYVAAMRRREKIAQGAIRLNKKTHRIDAQGQKQQIPADVAALMKAFNLDYEKAVVLKSVLAATKKA